MPLACKSFAKDADAAAYAPHKLHAMERDWPQTNCYADLWIEAVFARGCQPEAMFGFTLALDFEGDQFTFFKPSLDDIELLYGLQTVELSLFDDLCGQIETQCARGRLVMIEVDAYHLPDTRGVSYGLEHSKTTIGVNIFDRRREYADYFHNDGYFRAEGEDFRKLFGIGDKPDGWLFPYSEMIKPLDRPPLCAEALKACASDLLARHLRRRPPYNPIRLFAEAAPDLVARAQQKDPSFFHKFAFNTFRQVGANFELLAAHLDWLDAPLYMEPIEYARRISASAKALQFMMARAFMRNKPFECAEGLSEMARNYDALFGALEVERSVFKRAS